MKTDCVFVTLNADVVEPAIGVKSVIASAWSPLAAAPRQLLANSVQRKR